MFVGQSSIPLSSLPIISAAFSRLASTARSLSHSLHKLCSAPPAGDANSVSEKEKKKPIAPRKSNGAGFTVMAVLPWAGEGPAPGGERGRRAAAGAAAVGAQSAGGLQGALRAQDRRHPAAVAEGPAARHSRAKAGLCFASTFGFRRGLWASVHPLRSAPLATAALQPEVLTCICLCPTFVPIHQATLFPHVHGALLCAGRPRRVPGALQGHGSRHRGCWVPSSACSAGRSLGLSLPLKQPQGVP